MTNISKLCELIKGYCSDNIDSEQFQSELTELCNRYGIEANYTQVKKIFYEDGGNICG